MKLVVQIPCYNEEDTLPAVVAEIPRFVPGFDTVEILVVDDGSNDRTVEVARALGVDHIVRHRQNQGLARAFRTGLDAALAAGADVVVNTDGDNQYAGADIPRLTEPILAGTADIVVGDRQTHNIRHFSPIKKRLQALGSFMVRSLSGARIPDAVSGFRAISRSAALQLNIISPFSYTTEMLIQAGNKQLAIASVPVRTNPPTRRSRLARTTVEFLGKSTLTMARTHAMYKPLSTFFAIGGVLALVGVVPILRFLYFFVMGDGTGHIQSLVLGGVLVVVGFVTLMIGIVADLINFNRHLIEITLEKVRRLELEHSATRKEPYR
jgi:glycosyltransferase involved in cell wall biosynthesis